MKDLIDELHATSRTVGRGALPAGEAKVVTLSRRYPADVDDVWDALTDPERIARWFLPITGDLRLGGRYQLEGNAGGEIRVCEPPRRLQVTWLPGEHPGADTTSADSSIVEVRLEPDPEGGTRLDLVHTAVVPPEFWDGYGPGAVGVGWDLTVLGLAAHLSDVEIGDPAQLDSDPRMRAVMTASSEAWGVALSETGEDPAEVDRLVAATTAFYVPPLD